jgi:CBS-domain-containing membrane protein
LAVGLAMLLMVVTNTEHPPAAALAMGIAVEGADLAAVVTVYICLAIVFIGKKVLDRWLIDLM